MFDKSSLFAAGSQILSHIVVGLDIHSLHLVVLLVLELDEVIIFIFSLVFFFGFFIKFLFCLILISSGLHKDLASGARRGQGTCLCQSVQTVQRLQSLGHLVIGEEGVVLQGDQLLLMLCQASLSKEDSASY